MATDPPASADVPDAAALRAMGIDHPDLRSDEELVTLVQMLVEFGAPLESLVDEDLGFVAAPRLIRPDASIPLADLLEQIEGEFLNKTRIALGLAMQDGTPLLTPAEVEAYLLFDGLRPLIGDEEMLGLLRVLGVALARIARSVISALRLNYETPIVDETGNLLDVTHAYANLTSDLLPPFLDAVSTILRRHLSVLASQPATWSVDENNAATTEELAVGFIDLVGFTSFTEQADAREFIEALTAFERRAQEVIVDNGGTLVKLIGDEIMFVAPTPTAAVTIARDLNTVELGDGPNAMRTGLAAGDVVAVGGDYYGTVVNTASRILDFAEPDEILVTAAVAERSHATMTFDAIGARRIRGLREPVDLFRLSV